MNKVYITEATYQSLAYSSNYRNVTGVYHTNSDCHLLYQNHVKYDKKKLQLNREQSILFYKLISEIENKKDKEELEIFKGILSQLFPTIEFEVSVNTGVIPVDLSYAHSVGATPCQGCSNVDEF